MPRSTLSSGLLRGLAAGAAGTTVLNAVTYLDMAVTGRAASSAPTDTVLAAADLVGLELSTKGARDEAYGALAGLGVGTGIGVVAGLVRAAGIRLPLLAESAVIGIGAMAATDGPMAVLDVTDMTTWAGTDWVRDVVPHLAFGAAVAATLRGMEPEGGEETPRQPARPGRVLARSLAIGIATGARSSLGLVPPAVVGGTAPALISAGLVGTELTMDKLPSTPSRVGGPTVLRVGSAAAGAATLARHEDTGVLPAVAAGAFGAVVGTILGSVWRDSAEQRGWTWQGAAVEDVVALALTAWAWRS